MSDSILRELEAEGLARKPAPKLPVAQTAPSVSMAPVVQATEAQTAVLSDTLKRIESLLAQKREVRFDVHRGSDDRIDYVIARPQ